MEKRKAADAHDVMEKQMAADAHDDCWALRLLVEKRKALGPPPANGETEGS